jgi:Zn-dependent protease with chaperone function
MESGKLRCRGDRELAKQLLEERLVTRTVEQLEEQADKGPRGVRRQLLASALRLTPSMLPELAEMIEACRVALSVDIPLETYVYPSATFNAACVKPEKGRLFILLSSSLLEAFEGGELRFVLGHELGHHLFGHHDIPIGYIIEGEDKPSPELALKLFSWSRYAEISADRAGAVCAADPDAVARALFRLASGLRGQMVRVRIDEFAAQVDDVRLEDAEPGRGAPISDWFSTHPFSPLRVKALHAFATSELAQAGGRSLDELEGEVETLMALMEPSYLEERSEEAETMRRLLFAGAVAVADASDGISDKELATFEKFFGQGSFSKQLDVQAIKREIPHRISEAKARVRVARRVQVMRDLCLIARADGHAGSAEIEVMHGLARDLDIPLAVIDRALHGSLDPD